MSKVLIIGGNKGLGLELVNQLKGHEVLALSRSSEPPLDLHWSEVAIRSTVKTAIKALGGIDVLLVSSGAGAYLNPIPECGAVENLFQVNTLGPISVFHAAYKELLRSKGKAIFISSVCARRPGSGGLSIYGSSKAALNSFVMNEGRRAAKHGVALCSVSVGFFTSPMTQDMAPGLIEATVKAIPFGRWGECAEIAKFTVSLLDQSNWCLAGSDFQISGGA